VEEEVADEASGGSDLDPSASRALITLVDAFPWELGDRRRCGRDSGLPCPCAPAEACSL